MIKLVNVSKYYNTNNVVALGLRKVNVELAVNEFVAIVGESGSGKTTLLNVICGIDTYEDGEMFINGEETSYFSTNDLENYRKKYVAFIFQNYNLIDSYTVLQNVEAPLILSGYPRKQIRSRAIEIIRRVGLEDHLHHKATKLSGGQKQRVVIARALAKDCPIIAADEPTGNLDSESAKQIMILLAEIAKEKLVIVVTHEYEQVKEYATRKIRIYDGEIVEDIEVKPTQKANLPKLEDQSVKIRYWDNWLIALRNLFAVPKKTFMMIIVFAFFSFFVALAYGGFNSSLSDFDTGYNFYFTNTSASRVILRKTDKTPFTQADLDELAGFALVESIVGNDYILDAQISMTDSNDPNNWDRSYLTISVLPLDIITVDELAYGRLPQNDNEVVLAISGADAAGDYLDTTYYYNSWGEASSSNTTFDNLKIVGIVDSSKVFMNSSMTFGTAYFLTTNAVIDAYRQTFYARYVSGEIFVGVDQDSVSVTTSSILERSTITIDDTIANNTIVLPSYMSYEFCDPGVINCTLIGDYTITDFYRSETITDFTISFNSNENIYVSKVNQATYDAIVGNETYQVSLLTNADVGVEGLIREIARINQGLLPKYKLFYPYNSQATDYFSALLILMSSIGLIVTLIVTIIASTLITFLIFKAIINTKLHDYAIFRTIGANKAMIKRMIYMENIITAVFGFVLVIIAVVLLNAYTTIFGQVLKYYDFFGYMGLGGIMLLMAILISRRYNHKIFKESVNKTLKVE